MKPWFTILLSQVTAERHRLSCCRYAKFNERDYERTGTMYLGGEDGTEVPMYSSVGTTENGGNMLTINWNTGEDENGKLVAWPSINEAKMEDIGQGNPIMVMEEVGVATERRSVEGSLKCPDELTFNDIDKNVVNWTCDETKIEECKDQLETCPTVAVTNRCQTMAQICCATCEQFFANRTAEIELERERAQNVTSGSSISIGSSMSLAPAGEERQATVNGGALADEFDTATEAGVANDDDPADQVPGNQTTATNTEDSANENKTEDIHDHSHDNHSHESENESSAIVSKAIFILLTSLLFL